MPDVHGRFHESVDDRLRELGIQRSEPGCGCGKVRFRELDAAVEITGIHLIAASEVGKLEIVPLPKSGAALADAMKGEREVDYATEGTHVATIYNGEKLEPGMTFAGPAIIEDPGTTVVVHPGNTVSIDDFGNIHIETRS